MRRRITCLILLAGLAGLVAACGAAAPQAVTETAGPPLLETATGTATATATVTALPASAEPFESPLSSPEPFDSPPASPTPEARAPLSLVVLHSNDNWGETEPCG